MKSTNVQESTYIEVAYPPSAIVTAQAQLSHRPWIENVAIDFGELEYRLLLIYNFFGKKVTEGIRISW